MRSSIYEEKFAFRGLGELQSGLPGNATLSESMSERHIQEPLVYEC